MYKIIAVGGQLRGQEFELNSGANIIGRSSECDISLSVEGVSKRHLSLTVNEDNVYLEDLGSSNGTFVEGKLIRAKTIKAGDKIAVPNVIFQLVKIKEKKVTIKKQVPKAASENEDFSIDDKKPDNLLGKIQYAFKTNIMKVIYSFNEQYEWNVILGFFIFIFICINIAVTIGPVLLDSKKILMTEVKARGEQFASEVVRTNTVALSRGDLDEIDTTFLDSDIEGLSSYELFDLEGRIVRPISKLNLTTTEPFSVNAKNFYASGDKITEVYNEIDGDIIGVAKSINAYQVKTGQTIPIGVIAIKFKPLSLQKQAANNSYAYLKSLIYTSAVGIFFFGLIYYLTTKPIFEMKKQIEDSLRGKRKDLESKLLMNEIHPLRSVVNTLLQRIRELQNDDHGDFQEIEDDASYVRTMQEVMAGAGCPAMILNSEKLITYLNSEGEDLTGIRESVSAGESLLDTARDQGFAATVIDLCDKSSNNEGSNQAEVYELSGRSYEINVMSLIGKDNFAKVFYITFVLDE